MNTEEILKTAVAALDDKKGINIRVLDISRISVVADYFVIASGSVKSHVQALADNALDGLLKKQVHARQIEGFSSAGWILMDYGDVVVHIFNHDDRIFYDIERIWKDGTPVDVEELLK